MEGRRREGEKEGEVRGGSRSTRHARSGPDTHRNRAPGALPAHTVPPTPTTHPEHTCHSTDTARVLRGMFRYASLNEWQSVLRGYIDQATQHIVRAAVTQGHAEASHPARHGATGGEGWGASTSTPLSAETAAARQEILAAARQTFPALLEQLLHLQAPHRPSASMILAQGAEATSSHCFFKAAGTRGD